MAITNHERVGKSLELLKAGLGPFVDREVKGALESRRLDAFKLRDYSEDRVLANKPTSEWDVAALLKLMWETWNEVFRAILGRAERSLVSEIREHRNKWAHQESFSSDDAYRALDSVGRLLAAVSAPQSDELERLKMELLRVRFDEQARGERRRQAGVAIESAAAAGLKPWREIVTPHKDVASGRYQQAEFAADLWQVHLGEGTDEYRDPVEFFRRTYLTESLKGLLVGAVHRLAGRGGDPVVQLQTNFGGGKTHSMLALYHLFSGTTPGELAGIDAVLQEAQATELGAARRVVLVGNKISPGNPVTKEDGTVVRTLWGELAWQLGGKKAFARISADDENATNPGDALRELFNEYGPCLVLIDEWVAYARQLHDQSDLPAGSFETQFSFAQALTESAKLANHCLLVISLPASDTSGSPHTRADDVEVGGQRGREALDRLRNVVGRIESSWRPASAEEGFEIVRRRLFEPFSDPSQFKDRDVVARSFAELYRTQHQEFPPECRDVDYEKRIKAAYPIHPEIFDRLYTDWSTLVKFQRTRGVLRLMAAVIHSLWEKGDRNALILPANVAIDDSRVQFELTRYLADNWVPVIERDVDGPSSLPLRLDGEVPNLGKFAASRRVARAIYLGSAPTADAAQRGIEDRSVKLGCVMPGESPAVFGDALRRLAGAATYLYQDGPRYWYSTQPTVTKLAEDRAEQLRRDPDKVVQELGSRLRTDFATRENSAVFIPSRRPVRTFRTTVMRDWWCSGPTRPTARNGAIRRDSRESHPGIEGQRSQDLPQHTRVPGRGQDEAAGPRRGGPAISGVGVDPRGARAARPLAVPGEAGRDPEGSRLQCGDRPAPGGVPVAPDSGTDASRCAGRVVGHEVVGPGPAGGEGEQEAEGRRASRDRICPHATADGARSRPAVARRRRVGQANRRGLCALPLSAACRRPHGSAAVGERRGRSSHLGARRVRARGQLRRGGEALSRAAWRTGCYVVGCRCTRVARQAGCRTAAARCGERRTCWSGTCCPEGWSDADSWCRAGTRIGTNGTT